MKLKTYKKMIPILLDKKGKAVYRRDRMRRYPVCRVPYLQGWVPKRTANFIFGFTQYPDDWYLSLIPKEMNPSLWEHNSGSPAIRVPFKYKKKAWGILYRKRLWYYGSKNRWQERYRTYSWKERWGWEKFIPDVQASRQKEMKQAIREIQDKYDIKNVRSRELKMARQKLILADYGRPR